MCFFVIDKLFVSEAVAVVVFDKLVFTFIQAIIALSVEIFYNDILIIGI